MCLATCFFALMGISVKLLPDIPFHEIIFFRSCVSAILCTIAIHRQKIPLFGHRNNRHLLLTRGILGTLGLCCLFFSIKQLSFAYAITLQQMSPLFTILLSAIIWRRKVKFTQYLACILATFGIYWIYQAHIDKFDFFYLHWHTRSTFYQHNPPDYLPIKN